MASRPPDITPPTALERQRWLVLSVMRFAGFGLVLLGILMIRGAVDILGDQNALVGYLFVVIGLADGFLMPLVLARKWRTPGE